MKPNRVAPLLVATAALFAAPCQAIVISLNPLSNDSHVFGTWHQRQFGADDGMWYLPGFVLELGVGREGAMPWYGSDEPGRWDVVVCNFSVMGGPWEANPGWIYNDADDLDDDSQSRTTQGYDGLSYTFTFDGTYFPDTDEWDGTFSAVTSQLTTHRFEVPEGGGSLVLLCGAMAGVFMLKRRWT